MEFRTLREAELEVWAEHCEGVFGDTPKEYFVRHYRDDPWRDTNGIFVADDGGVIASTLRVFRRQVRFGGERVGMGGIGEVSTKKEYRGRGLAGMLLEMAIQYMQREELKVSLLFTGAANGFYRKFGWDDLLKPYRRFHTTAGAPVEGRALGEEDMPQMRAVDGAAVPANWAVVRDGAQYWDKWMRSALAGRMKYGAFEAGELVAWLTAERTDTGFAVSEFKAMPGKEGLFGDLCALLAAREGLEGKPFTAPAWYSPHTAVESEYTEKGGMVRLISPFRLNNLDIEDTAQLISATQALMDSSLDHF